MIEMIKSTSKILVGLGLLFSFNPILSLLANEANISRAEPQDPIILHFSGTVSDLQQCQYSMLSEFQFLCKERFEVTEETIDLFYEKPYPFRYIYFDFNRDGNVDLYLLAQTGIECGKNCSSEIYLGNGRKDETIIAEKIHMPSIGEEVVLIWPDLGALGAISYPDSSDYSYEANIDDHKFDIEQRILEFKY